MKQPRVLLIQTQAENAGAQEIARNVGDGLQSRGFDAHHVFFFRRTSAFDNLPNVHFCTDRRPGNPLALLQMIGTLGGLIRRLEPDAVMCFQHFGNLIAAPVARVAGQKVVIANQNTARDQMKRWVVGADMLLGTIGVYSHIVVNSDVTAHEYDWEPQGYRRRITRIDHGFKLKRPSMSRAMARDSFKLPADGVLLGLVARLHADKNQEAAIRALALRPGYRLAFMGQGAAEHDLRRLAADLGCAERVHFVGEHPPERVGDFLGALDVFVFPSRMETFGLAAVEAAAAGVPVVSNDHPVMREVLMVGDEPCAVFTDVDDPQAFAAAIDRVVEDEALRSRLGEIGPRLSDRYSLDAMVEGYIALIEGALRSSAGTPARGRAA